MRLIAALALCALLPQDDPVAALKELAKSPDEKRARQTLVEGLEREIAAGVKALDENRPDEAEKRLARAATLARPYSEAYARLLVNVILTTRRQVRAESSALVRGIVEDIRAKKSWIPRFHAAKSEGAIRVYADRFAALEAAAKAWEAAPPDAAAVDAEVAKWHAIRHAGPALGCGTCKGGGESACVCKEGVVTLACKMCKGAGTIQCLLCEGKGSIAHHGYVGTIRLTLEKAITVRIVLANGRTTNAKLHPQVLTWTLGPCAGKGKLTLKTSSKPLDPAMKPAAPVTKEQDCNRVWKELRDFAFTGRSKIEIQAEGGKMVAMEPQAAKRFLADYEKCRDGKLDCERCERKFVNRCISCLGRASSSGPCGECAGASAKLCAACGFVGDTAWIGLLVPPASVPGLASSLDGHAEALRGWQQYRAYSAARRDAVAAQLRKAKEGLDPTAQIHPTYVNIACWICKGKGGDCDDCWGTGRREFYEGTPQYDAYATVARLERQQGEMAKEARRAAPPASIRIAAPKPPDPAPPKPPDPVPPKPPDPAPPKPGDPPPAQPGPGIAALPKTIQDMIAAADAACAQGLKHLEAARAANENTDAWIAESRKALEKLREAQTGYVSAQEACDREQVDVPAELLAKLRRNMQALVIARKQAP